ncbi:MAG: hypothetical protein H7833_16285 [Magnetococcus sp. DMHC-1]|nr:hypothetical protein [Magnetococcales bacterium]
MHALREIVDDAPERLTVELPLHLHHRRVEVIVIPLDEIEERPLQMKSPNYRIFPTDQVVILPREMLHER